MKHVSLATLIGLGGLAGSQLTGCIISSRDQPEVGYITAYWELRDVSGTTTICPSGFTTAVLMSQPLSDSGDPIGAPIMDKFDCDDRGGETFALTPGPYQTWLEIRSDDLVSLYARSYAQFPDITHRDATVDFEVLNDGGYLELRWELRDAMTDVPISCADANVVSVQATATSATSSFTAIAPCGDLYALSAPQLEGTYTVSVAALGAGEAPIAVAPDITDQVINRELPVTDLGTVLIPVE
ncbi:MAG: hypothetical protein AB7P03_17245 [Kofleriaceae bacterium]